MLLNTTPQVDFIVQREAFSQHTQLLDLFTKYRFGNTLILITLVRDSCCNYPSVVLTAGLQQEEQKRQIRHSLLQNTIQNPNTPICTSAGRDRETVLICKRNVPITLLRKISANTEINRRLISTVKSCRPATAKLITVNLIRGL